MKTAARMKTAACNGPTRATDAVDSSPSKDALRRAHKNAINAIDVRLKRLKQTEGKSS